MEEEVLNGGNNFLINNTAPIILEYQRKAYEKFSGKNIENVINLLYKLEYDIYALDGKGGLIQFQKSLSYENIIALKKHNQKIIKILSK